MPWRRARSIRNTLLAVVLATTFAALLVAGIALVVYDVLTYQKSWVNDLQTQADILGGASAPALAFDDPKVARENLELLKTRPAVLAAAIYTAKGGLFASYTRTGVADPRLPNLPEADGHRIDGDEIVVFKRIEAANEILGTVYLRARYELPARIRNYAGILGAVMVISLLAAALISSWLATIVTKPIFAISNVAHKVVESRDFSLRATKITQDEIGYLTDAFNDMLTEIGRRAAALEDANRTLEHEMAERRAAEQALLAADRRKDEFLATLAHELRNPLAPLRNALYILRSTGDDAQAAQAAREMMERQLQQLVRLVDDLLDVSRITTGKLTLKRERMELRAAVDNALDAARPLIDARRHQLSVNLPAEPIYLDADVTRLSQVFLNLLNNAAKFTDPGGRIAFSAELDRDTVTVTVTDTGIGLSAEMLPAIFEMFTQVDRSLERQFAGLGVGLSLARRLVELHGGTLVAHSNGLGRGSRFTVRLPVATGEKRERARHPEQGAVAAGAKHRILLADDNEDFATSLALLLRTMGHEVRIAYDGLQAMEAAVEFKPEFAFLDIGLPALNGYELARRLRELPSTKHAVLIAVTGWGQEDDKHRAFEAGFDRHMVKPVDPEHIYAILAQRRD